MSWRPRVLVLHQVVAMHVRPIAYVGSVARTTVVTRYAGRVIAFIIIIIAFFATLTTLAIVRTHLAFIRTSLALIRTTLAFMIVGHTPHTEVFLWRR